MESLGGKMTLYKAIRETLNSKPRLVPENEDVVLSNDKDYYQSLFLYNETHRKYFQSNNTLSGIRNTTTNKLFFDFDYEKDIDKARSDAVALCHRLIDQYNIDSEAIGVQFSGKKGWSVELYLDTYITPEQFKNAVFKLAGDLLTFDTVVNDANRVIRIPNSKHQDSKLYKIPLELSELDTMSIEDIKELAKKPRAYNKKTIKVKFDDKVYLPSVEIKTTVIPEKRYTNLSFSDKPKFLSNCRYALKQGYFGQGDRNTALVCLASTYKNLGFDKDDTYRMLKSAAQKQSELEATERYPDSEIFNNVVMQVFGPHWKNGQYSCRQEGNWLYNYCKALGDNKCDHKSEDDMQPKTLVDIRLSFKDYVKNIDKNTIITGIPSIDNNVFISTGANVGIIGAPGSGKSSLALNILNNTSKLGVKSVFASLDMHHNRMFEKVMYKITGKGREELYKIFQEDREGPYIEQLKEEFGNVNFFNRSSPTVQDVREYILACQERNGEKVKLVMLDYFERISSDHGDDTAASKRVAGELQDLVNDLDIALITLVQPHKNALSGGVDSPLLEYTNIKGSSYVYQAFRIIMSLWRPFYNPQDFSKDKYMQMAVLKNDLGELGQFDFKWDGPKGEISELEDDDYRTLKQWLKEKKNEKVELGSGTDWGN